MTNTPDDLPPSLRFLRGLVIVLMITMIVGVITVVATLVTRMPDARDLRPILPEQITLPAGETALTITMGSGWFAVVTRSQQILIYDAAGNLTQTVQITP